MENKDLEKLKYPIGTYEVPQAGNKRH